MSGETSASAAETRTSFGAQSTASASTGGDEEQLLGGSRHRSDRKESRHALGKSEAMGLLMHLFPLIYLSASLVIRTWFTSSPTTPFIALYCTVAVVTISYTYWLFSAVQLKDQITGEAQILRIYDKDLETRRVRLNPEWTMEIELDKEPVWRRLSSGANTAPALPTLFVHSSHSAL